MPGLGTALAVMATARVGAAIADWQSGRKRIPARSSRPQSAQRPTTIDHSTQLGV
jgi:hypothetical protein